MDYEEGKKYEKKDFRKLYEELVKSDWFKKAYNNKSLGECPLDFPELKESEDERIRKEIIEFISWAESRGSVRSDWHQKKRPGNWIAYLEKQKEQKPILEVFGFKVGDAVRLKDGDGRKHIIKSFEEVEGIHGPNFYHVEFEDNSARDGIYPGEEYPNGYYTQMEKFEDEQKPVEPSDDELQRHQDELHAFKVFAAKQAKEHHISFSFDHDFEWHNFCAELLSYLNEKQKPVEWSEEDEKMLKSITGDLFCGTDFNMELKFAASKKVNWLKDKFNSLRLQPKQDCGKATINGEPIPTENHSVDIPLAKWSEEDKRNLNRIYEILGYAADDRGFLTSKRIIGDKEAIELQDFLKSLRPSWKPSEEQMGTLERWLLDNKFKGDSRYVYPIFESLYNDLKKLM